MNRTESDAIGARKAELRMKCRAYRSSLTDDEYVRLSAAIVEHAADLPELCLADTVHVYWPVPSEREVDTRPLVARLESRGADIVLPVVESFDRSDTPNLRHVRYPGAEELRTNRWGIAEPAEGQSVDVGALDAVVVPALGAGRNGHRVGHGWGYYDAFLAGVRAPKICLIYEACLVEAVPCAAHDVRMDVVVTEREVIRVVT